MSHVDHPHPADKLTALDVAQPENNSNCSAYASSYKLSESIHSAVL